MNTCLNCGRELADGDRYCPSCGREVVDYPRPAGFWIRVGASLLDALVLSPLVVLYTQNIFSIKSPLLMAILCVPGLVYKPVMEWYWGATVGKMACGLRVIDRDGGRLSLRAAYLRFFPNILSMTVYFLAIFPLFFSPQFESVTDPAALGKLLENNPIGPFGMLTDLFLITDCLAVPFMYRKRAIHDLMAGSYCVLEKRRQRSDVDRRDI